MAHRAGVRTMITLQSAAQDDSAVASTAVSTRWQRWRLGWGWRGTMAGFASGVALTLALTYIAPRLMLQDSLPAELVVSHV